MNELNLNIFNLLILLGILHGFIFGVILLLNKNLRRRANTYLALTVYSLSLSNLQYWLLDTGITLKTQYNNNSLIFVPFEFLILPFFYLFVKNYIGKKISKNEQLFLFIPFILSLIYILIRNSFSNSLSVIKIFNLVVEYISLLFTVVIIILIFNIIVSHEKSQIKQTNYKIVPFKIGWLKRLLIIGILLCFFWFLSISIFKDIYGSGYYKFYPLWIGISILLYWIAYVSIFQHNIYNERKLIRAKSVSNTSRHSVKNRINKDKYQNIYDMIISEKAYLDPKISLLVLSEKLNLSESHLSQIINQYSGKNYSTLINELRIEHVKKLLVKEEYSNYTITALGLESGFNTKTSFYSTFKKFTGKTPVEYKKSVQNY